MTTTSAVPLSLWRNRDYMLLWCGQTVNVIGTQVSQIAYPLLVLALTVVTTVYLGWHYVADAFGGVVLGVAGVAIAAWGTGNQLRRQPARAAASRSA